MVLWLQPHCGRVHLTFKIPSKDCGYVHVSVLTYLIMCINISMVLQEDPDRVEVSSLHGIVEGGLPRLQERREP